LAKAVFEVETQFNERSRWVRSQELPLTLVVCRDVRAATHLSGQLALGGDPKVARTHPQQRLAVVPLPRDDRLIAERSLPPVTWLATFRHEVAHLLSLDASELRSAPIWFQEGFAESFVEPRQDEWAAPDAWRSALTHLDRERTPVVDLFATLAPEHGLPARTALALASMEHSAAPNPWDAVTSWVTSDLLTRSHSAKGLSKDSFVPFETGLQLGREFDPPRSGVGPLLLAAFPGQSMTAVLERAWDPVEDRTYLVTVGRTGKSEGGLLLTGSGDWRLRIRFGQSGGVAAYLEPQNRTWSLPLKGQSPEAGFRPRKIELQIQDSTLHVHAAGLREEIPLTEGKFSPPFLVEAWVHDAALTVEF